MIGHLNENMTRNDESNIQSECSESISVRSTITTDHSKPPTSVTAKPRDSEETRRQLAMPTKTEEEEHSTPTTSTGQSPCMGTKGKMSKWQSSVIT